MTRGRGQNKPGQGGMLASKMDEIKMDYKFCLKKLCFTEQDSQIVLYSFYQMIVVEYFVEGHQIVIP